MRLLWLRIKNKVWTALHLPASSLGETPIRASMQELHFNSRAKKPEGYISLHESFPSELSYALSRIWAFLSSSTRPPSHSYTLIPLFNS
ncbi:hypothetical protein G7K_5509-t1 [Saitoella complicata NRRL Y-17804]|uniref:Uncharacterized protein n=1 Tax=Saitoella complicata (strain BCRC 22490 / CBS 7301 / JCM 7358 / NBRC 10748 / NRRL Y-17804) TaxID=698492 RepID=A0A0E9NNG6_SAICN|nr:hypothetical protein G7K_5509-t1 [Saitoella complicata NRRL Y-17804]